MLLDYILLIAVALLGVGLTVVGGVVASAKQWARLCFLLGGPLLVVGVIWQGIRQISAQSAGDSAFMAEVNARKEDRRLSDAKTDSLFALIQPVVLPSLSPPASKPSPPRRQHSGVPKGPLFPPANSTLSVSQSDKVSTRKDAPYEIEVVVQTSATFQSLKFAMQCDKPLADAQPMIGGASGTLQMMVSSGILKEHTNVFVYSYGSSVPPFGPPNPLIIDVWSKEPVKCDQVATF